MALSKFDRFIAANKNVETWTSGGNTGSPSRNTLTLTEEIDIKFRKFGTFSIDNADVILQVSKIEKIAPELIAVTWMNETTFRFYSEPNTNNQPNDFHKWDVGPLQMNVGWTLKDISINFFSDKGINVIEALGTSAGIYLFDGNPMSNLVLGSRRLLAGGRGKIIGKKNGEEFQMFEAVSPQLWFGMDVYTKNLRRAVAYTGPEARPKRLESYAKFAPMFVKFFEVYGKQ